MGPGRCTPQVLGLIFTSHALSESERFAVDYTDGVDFMVMGVSELSEYLRHEGVLQSWGSLRRSSHRETAKNQMEHIGSIQNPI